MIEGAFSLAYAVCVLCAIVCFLAALGSAMNGSRDDTPKFMFASGIIFSVAAFVLVEVLK